MQQNNWDELNAALSIQHPKEYANGHQNNGAKIDISLSSQPDLKLNFDRFYQVCDSLAPLRMRGDEQYYIDFADVRGGIMINSIRKKIKIFQNTGKNSSHQFFTGHIGGGKSTELHRLKKELLEQEGFHVIYFASDEDLDIHNVDIPDILLAIARQVIENLEDIGISLSPPFFQDLLKNVGDTLKTTEIGLNFPVGEAKISSEGINFSLPLGLAKISAKAKANPAERSQLRQYLEARTERLIDSLNHEILQPAIKQLQAIGKKGLVVIVDNLERISNHKIANSNFTQQEYVFVERGRILTEIQCHMVYTIPLALLYSTQASSFINSLGPDTWILPMISVKQRDNNDCERGLYLLKQLVMARAFPEVSSEQRLDSHLIQQIFQDEAILHRLCQISGGHVRTLLNLLKKCLLENDLPMLSDAMERSIRAYRKDMFPGIKTSDWELLRKVDRGELAVEDVENRQEWLHQLRILEYKDDDGETWLGINPLLKETVQFKSSL